MGCNCSEEKGTSSLNNNFKSSIIINKALTNKKNNNFINSKEDIDKISSLSSINTKNAINNKNKKDKDKEKNKNKKNKSEDKNNKKANIKNNFKNNIESDFSQKNSFPPTPHTFTDIRIKDYKNENIPLNKEFTCNISKINFNNNENKKYKLKQNQISPIKNLIYSLKKEADYKDNNKNLFLFYKGNKLNENETIYNIINKKNNQLENILNNNINNKQKDRNEIDFDMITYSIDEENINDEIIIKKEKESFSSNESEQEKIEKLKNEKNKVQIINKEKNISKKIMFKLSPKCERHNQENLIYICLTCLKSFCPLDYNEHKNEYKNHDIIQKTKLIELTSEIKKIKNNFIDIYKEILPDLYISSPGQNNSEMLENEKNNKLNYISSNDLFFKIKIAINDINEQMENLYDSYRQSYNKMNSKFLSEYEDKMPKIIEYDEYIEKTLINLENYNIYSNENIFIDNYNNCLNIKNNSNKYYQNIISLKEIIIKYKEFLELFKEKGKELIEYIRKGIDDIMKFKNGDKIFNLNGAFLQFNEKADIISRTNSYINSNNNNNIKHLNSISLTSNKDLNQIINLKFLLSEKKKNLSKTIFGRNFLSNNNINISNGCSTIIKNKKKNSLKESNNNENNNNNIEIQKNEKEKEIKPNEIILRSPSNISSKANFKFDINSPLKSPSNSINKENDLIQSHLCSLIYGTNKIIQYIHKTKQMNILSPDINSLKIKKFESYISYINYKNKFYISGGYSTSKQFFEYDIDNNIFIKLPEMLSNHYYHTMIGNNNYIYSVSGFKSKKIERYNILEKIWTSLPDLSYERTYPNVFIYNNNLFVFGKINNADNNNNIIEFLNIMTENNNLLWNQILIKDKIPFNSGMIFLDKNKILLVGGKIELNENSIDTCYYMTINNNENKYLVDIKLSEIKLELANEFNGNIFNILDENNLYYGLYSSIKPYFLCIFNKNANSFEYIQTDNKDNI